MHLSHQRPLLALLATLLGTAHPVMAQATAPVETPEVLPVPESTAALPDGAPLAAEGPLATDLPPETPAAPGQAAPSPNVTVNLISRLVQKGILTQEEATVLIQQAEADAATARAQAEAATAALPPPPTADDVRVTYVPQVVRNNIRDEIKQELMAQAAKEGWGEDDTPEWTKKYQPFGDLRVRAEGIYFGDTNDNTGSFPNFNAINTGAPFDTAGTTFSPQYNVDKDRNRTRLRARVGTDIMFGDGVYGGIRLATGDSNSPTSPNQTLGGSGGNFSKYSIWLDRAFLSYDAGPGDGEELTFMIGRFDNPFFSTEVQWDDDLGFDGLAVRGKVKLNENVTTFFTAGYFPVFNTDLNFATNNPSKFESTDKWLTGAQLGLSWKISDDLSAKFGIAYYDFNAIEGELSDPYTPLTTSDAGNTDSTRPLFAQRGNTYMALRDIVPTDANGQGTRLQYQYYGLATPFRNLTATGRLDYDAQQPYRLSLVGEATRNLAFDKSDIAAKAVNNLNGADEFEGGASAYNLALIYGNPALEKLGDWQASFGYRYVESDAIVDGFTDSDFGGGGTNVQGFSLGGNLALTSAVRLGLRWMSADEIAGPPLSTDTLQFDLNARF